MWWQACSILFWSKLLGPAHCSSGSGIIPRNLTLATDPFDHTWIDSYTALGDSYSVGLGSGNIMKPDSGVELNTDCRQYSSGYPNILNGDDVIGSNPNRKFQYFGCSGALVADIINRQVPKMQKSHVITLSAGGNDARLASILNYCVYTWLPSPGTSCESQLKAAKDATTSDQYKKDMTALLHGAQDKLKDDNSRIYWIAYERFWDTSTDECSNSSWSMGFTPGMSQNLTQERRDGINAVIDSINLAITNVCSTSDKCIFVDANTDTYDYQGHFCQSGVDESAAAGNGSNSRNRLQTWFYNWGTNLDADGNDGQDSSQPKKSLEDIDMANGTLASILARIDHSTFEGAITRWLIAGHYNEQLDPQYVESLPDLTANGSVLPDRYARIFHLNEHANSRTAMKILDAMDAAQAKMMEVPLMYTTLANCGPTPAQSSNPATAPTATRPYAATGSFRGAVDKCVFYMWEQRDCNAPKGVFQVWLQVWDAAGNELLGISPPRGDGVTPLPGTSVDRNNSQAWNANLQHDIVLKSDQTHDGVIDFEFGIIHWDSETTDTSKDTYCHDFLGWVHATRPQTGPYCDDHDELPVTRSVECFFPCPIDSTTSSETPSPTVTGPACGVESSQADGAYCVCSSDSNTVTAKPLQTPPPGKDQCSYSTLPAGDEVMSLAPSPTTDSAPPYSPTGSTGPDQIDKCHVHVWQRWNCDTSVGVYEVWLQVWDAAGNEMLGISPPRGDGPSPLPGTTLTSHNPQAWNANLPHDIVLNVPPDRTGRIGFTYGASKWQMTDEHTTNAQYCKSGDWYPKGGNQCGLVVVSNTPGEKAGQVHDGVTAREELSKSMMVSPASETFRVYDDISDKTQFSKQLVLFADILAAIPFRFKAGGDGTVKMPSVVPQSQHHHRNTTKVSHKPFKPRFTSKSALKDRSKGKLSNEGLPRKTRHQEVMSKFDRKNQAKQRKLNKAKDHSQIAQIFQGRDGAPRHVAVIPLCSIAIASAAVQKLNKSLDIEADVPDAGRTRIQIDRFKQKLAYTTVPRDVMAALDACRAADYVLLVLSAEEEVDELGELIIKAIEGQGISNVYTAVQSLDKVEPPKRRPQVVASLKAFITHFFPEQERVFSLDSTQECQNLLRSLCTTTPRGIRWREERSWMQVEEVRWPSDIPSSKPSATGQVIITGVVRGKNLKADRLIQVGDWGDFKISTITSTPLEQSRKGKDHAMAVDADMSNEALDRPTEDQDTLDDLAPEEAVMEDIEATTMAASTGASERRGVLLDDQRYFSDDEDVDDEARLPKRVPRGTSKYQAAWYLGDDSDSGSDMEDFNDEETGMHEEDNEMAEAGAMPADGMEGVIAPSLRDTEGAPSEYPQSEFFDDQPTSDAQLAEYRRKRQADAAEDDLRFPDEIELHPNASARERLARYRGLKSLRTSPWDTDEDRPHMPLDWPRLLDIADYKGARARANRETLVGGVKPGRRVSIYLQAVPLSLQQSYSSSQPLVAFSLLRHEHKRTAVNVSLSLSGEYVAPLKSKTELIVQIGPRRMAITPLFSQVGKTPNDVHKFERYLHPGRTAVASFTAPLTWGAVPALFFQRTSEMPAADTATPTLGDAANQGEMDTDTAPPALASAWSLIGRGTSLEPSTSRVVAKRVVLTGEPFRVNRRIVTVRYMFFSADDVAWFRALPLWTNRGRQGSIKESLGTHGHFKATFDAPINMQDAVGVSLYKRVWPRPARLLVAGEPW